MVQCGVIDLPAIDADRCRSRGGSGGKGNQLEQEEDIVNVAISLSYQAQGGESDVREGEVHF